MAVRTATAIRIWATDLRLAGSLLFLAGGLILMGIITAESLYPGGYSTALNEISDLGATRPPNSIIHQPSASIFNLSMTAIGVLITVAAWFIHRALGMRSVSIPIALLGIGSLGVGLFPGNTGAPHGIFAMVTFVSGGVAAITSARIARAPFRYVSIVFGAVALLSLGTQILLGAAGPLASLGIGGLERWVVYSTILWAAAFGGYLAGRSDGEPAGAGGR